MVISIVAYLAVIGAACLATCLLLSVLTYIVDKGVRAFLSLQSFLNGRFTPGKSLCITGAAMALVAFLFVASSVFASWVFR